jgi:hypothetical protein
MTETAVGTSGNLDVECFAGKLSPKGEQAIVQGKAGFGA